MTYAPAHNFHARDGSYTHTHTTGLTPFLVAKERKLRFPSTALVLTSVISQCVTKKKKKKVMLYQSERVLLDTQRGTRAGGAEL